MTTGLKKPACRDCKFYENGKCKRFPPTIDPNYGISCFPTIGKDEWCGEFKHSEKFEGWVVLDPKKEINKKK